MHTFVRTALVIALVTCPIACKKLTGHASAAEAKPSSAECDQLMQHQAEIIAGKGASQGAIDAARMVLVKSETTSGWCKDMERAQYDCEMKATTKAAMDACDK